MAVESTYQGTYLWFQTAMDVIRSGEYGWAKYVLGIRCRTGVLIDSRFSIVD